MALLRFTNPTDIPAYRGWDFRVFGAEITLRAEDLGDFYALQLEAHRHFCNLPHHQMHADASRLTKLHDLLDESVKANRDVTVDGHDVWGDVANLMFSQRFVSVFCPECRQAFAPKECRVLPWQHGSNLAAEGGQRVVCPAGHTMYARVRWNS